MRREVLPRPTVGWSLFTVQVLPHVPQGPGETITVHISITQSWKRQTCDATTERRPTLAVKFALHESDKTFSTLKLEKLKRALLPLSPLIGEVDAYSRETISYFPPPFELYLMLNAICSNPFCTKKFERRRYECFFCPPPPMVFGLRPTWSVLGHLKVAQPRLLWDPVSS